MHGSRKRALPLTPPLAANHLQLALSIGLFKCTFLRWRTSDRILIGDAIFGGVGSVTTPDPQRRVANEVRPIFLFLFSLFFSTVSLSFPFPLSPLLTLGHRCGMCYLLVVSIDSGVSKVRCSVRMLPKEATYLYKVQMYCPHGLLSLVI